MGRPASTRPTDTETEVANIVWGMNKSVTIAEIAENLNPRRAYTSVATIVRIMVDKGYLAIVSEKRPQTFRALITKESILSDGIDHFLHRYGDMIPDKTRKILTDLSVNTRSDPNISKGSKKGVKQEA
jgi:predicted transcriptional regulator